MSRRAVVVIVLAGALLACGRAAPPAAERATVERAPEPDVDSDNLLNLAYGSSVVSRTGELNLEWSAVHAIDGFPGSMWVSAPGSPNETIVYSLLAPARVTQIGVSPLANVEVPSRVRFDASLDGTQWRELATIEPQPTDERQLFSVTPTVARYIRVETFGEGKYYVRARGFHAIGGEVEPPSTPPFGGCWTINGWPARLVQDGARITGTIAADPPIHLDGGTDNRVAMVMWMQGPTWGYAALTRTPDGQHIAGLRFFEEIDSRNLGEGWFGEKCGDVGRASARPGRASARPGRAEARPTFDFLQRAGRYSAYGLAFDAGGRLIEELSRAALRDITAMRPQRMIIHELRYDTRQENERVAEAKAASLRTIFPNVRIEARGDAWNGPPIGTAVQRLLGSRVDIIPPP